MDCSSEEQMIRMKLTNLESFKSLQFNIPNRKIEVYNYEDSDIIFKTIDSLKLETKLISVETGPDDLFVSEEKDERKLFL